MFYAYIFYQVNVVGKLKKMCMFIFDPKLQSGHRPFLYSRALLLFGSKRVRPIIVINLIFYYKVISHHILEP